MVIHNLAFSLLVSIYFRGTLGSNNVTGTSTTVQSFTEIPFNNSTTIPVHKILGGRPAVQGQFKYQVAMLKGDFQFCAGSLISPRHVLTAAHCTNGQIPHRISVRLGSTNSQFHGVVIKVANILQHPQFNSEITDFDLSILVLERPVQLSNTIDVVRLPPLHSEPSEGTRVTVIGWGATEDGGPTTENLMYLDLSIVRWSYCKFRHPSITRNMICAGGEYHRGDSGGPLVISDYYPKTQVGIVSWGVGCGDYGVPGIYTHVARFVDWITEQIQSS